MDATDATTYSSEQQREPSIDAACISASAPLVQAAYDKQPELPNLLLDPEIAAQLAQSVGGWRRLVCVALQHGVPVPALSGSLAGPSTPCQVHQRT